MDWPLAVLRLLAIAAGISFLGGVVFGFRPTREGTALRVLLLLSFTGAYSVGLHAAWYTPKGSVVVGSFTILAVSLCLFWTALLAHGQQRPAKAGSVSAPTKLCFAGPYRIIRHTLYTSYQLGLGSLLMHCSEWWAWAACVVVGCQYLYFARMEERAILASPLGETYATYMRKTGRFLPKFFTDK